MYNKLYEDSRRSKSRNNRKNRHDYKNRNNKLNDKSDEKDDKSNANYVEVDYTLDGSVKQLFLNLTKMQIPFNFEKTLETYFPEGMETDEHGNYFKKVGDSKVMFCGHLDTYCREYTKVLHVIEGDIIKTDGTTTLGGDDKAGILLMIKMIDANVPGLYYFFRGEEGVTSPTGTWGSRQALKTRKDFFTGYEKCVAFDRKGTTSIISQQMYSECCSPDFVNALSSEFKKNGLNYVSDGTGMWCDSGVFMEIIPECTNISVGYKSEHRFSEEQDIGHLEKLATAVVNIDWENLPTKRDPKKVSTRIGRYDYDWESEWDYYGVSGYKKNYRKQNQIGSSINGIYRSVVNQGNKNVDKYYGTMTDLFGDVTELMRDAGFSCLNDNIFQESEEMYFMNYDTDDFIGIRIIDFDIYMSEDSTLKKYNNYGDLGNFKKFIMTGIHPNDIENVNNDNNNKNSRTIPNDNSLLKKQSDTFKSFLKKYPHVVKSIMTNMENRSNKTYDGLKHDLWLKIDKLMNDEHYKVRYGDEIGNVNPDSLDKWIFDNWFDAKVHVDDAIKKETDKIKKYEIGFLSTLSDKDFDYTKFTYNQYIMFGNLVDNDKELVKLVLKDLEINKTATVRVTTADKITDSLVRLGYSNIKDELITTRWVFVRWLNRFRDEVEKYYHI